VPDVPPDAGFTYDTDFAFSSAALNVSGRGQIGRRRASPDANANQPPREIDFRPLHHQVVLLERIDGGGGDDDKVGLSPAARRFCRAPVVSTT
jgi:hypothetical protein